MDLITCPDADDTRRCLYLNFFDTGHGIEESKFNKLFKVFGKLEDPGEINHEGTGLGLYITNTLVT